MNEQLPLFDLAKLQEHGKRPPKRYWYYLTTPRNTLMMLTMDDDGKPVLVEHGTRLGIDPTPHLWSSRREAERYRDYHLKGGHVNKWVVRRE